MAVTFDYSGYIASVYDILKGTEAAPTYVSEKHNHPFANQIFFQTIFDSGHTGTTLFIEYCFAFCFHPCTAAISYKWQHKVSGGAWVDFANGTASGSVTLRKTGIIITALDMPLEIRLSCTSSSAGEVALNFSVSNAYLMLRAVGTI